MSNASVQIPYHFPSTLKDDFRDQLMYFSFHKELQVPYNTTLVQKMCNFDPPEDVATVNQIM